jgi:hypothetical protein
LPAREPITMRVNFNLGMSERVVTPDAPAGFEHLRHFLACLECDPSVSGLGSVCVSGLPLRGPAHADTRDQIRVGVTEKLDTPKLLELSRSPALPPTRARSAIIAP